MLIDMDPKDIANILTRLTSRPYITQEVSFRRRLRRKSLTEGFLNMQVVFLPEPVTPNLYTENGDVQE